MSSSEQETISTFRSADLPKVCIPVDFESSMESSESDNEGDFIFKVPTTPTDLTPATSTPTNRMCVCVFTFNAILLPEVSVQYID